jgi:O-antigen/teichoic acid export membrane protein
VLLGAERNDIALAFQGGSGVLALLIVLLAAAIHAPLWAYVAAPSAGAALAAAAAWPMASSASGLSLPDTVRSALVGARQGARIAHLAGPMLVITAALPIAFQSDRLLLSHLSNLRQVAVYAVGAQLYVPLLGLIGAAGMSLWPMFARRRAHQPIVRHELIKLSAVFTLVGMLLAVALIAAGPWVAQFVSRGKIDVGYGVFAAFGLLLVVQASWLPTGWLMTDRDGLRFQAVASVIMMVINVAASAVLAHRVGAAGPILSSAGAMFIAMWVPGVWRALTHAQR